MGLILGQGTYKKETNHIPSHIDVSLSLSYPLSKNNEKSVLGWGYIFLNSYINSCIFAWHILDISQALKINVTATELIFFCETAPLFVFPISIISLIVVFCSVCSHSLYQIHAIFPHSVFKIYKLYLKNPTIVNIMTTVCAALMKPGIQGH